MKKLISLILVSLLVLGGVLYLPEFSDKSMLVEGKIYGENATLGVAMSRGSGNIYYVSTSGKDSNNGTNKASAWRTITYAATKATAGDTVYVKKGDYGDEEVVGDTVVYSGGYNYPSYYGGGGGSARPQYRSAPANIGLVSWSI